MGRTGTSGVWPCLLITRRSQVQIPPPLLTRQRQKARANVAQAPNFLGINFEGGLGTLLRADLPASSCQSKMDR
jgi:hypothetical protein